MVRNSDASAVLFLLTALSASGCGGGSAGSGTSSSPAPSPSAPATTEAAEPEPARRPQSPELPDTLNTQAGRKAFAVHVADVWGYALRTNDARQLLELSPKNEPCTGCQQLRSELRRRDKSGWYVDFPGVSVKKT